MKKIRFFALFLCLTILISSLNEFVYATQIDDSQQAQSQQVAITDASYGLDGTTAFLGSGQLVENVEAAFLYEIETDTLMYAWNPDVRVYPSSLVKILTALIAVEEGDPGDVVTVKEDTLSSVPIDAVSADLQPGEEISLGDLIYCMLVGSGNDAAAVIAEHIYGDQQTFVQKMNEYAVKLGCTATQFRNVHGLHDEEQFTSARDLARIVSTALKNESFTTYFSTVNYTVPATNLSEERKLSTGNFLMNRDSMEIYYDERVTGGRTGLTEDGNRCLAASAKSNGLNLISIVMGSKSTYDDRGNTQVYGSFKETTALFDAAFSGYKASRILFKEQALKQCSVVNGSNDVILGTKVDVSTVLPDTVTLADLSFQYSNIDQGFQAPISEGQKLSDLEVWYGTVCVAKAEVFAMNSVPRHDAQPVVQPSGTNGGLTTTSSLIIWIICGAVVLFLVLVFAGRTSHILKRMHTKRYRRDRRRSR